MLARTVLTKWTQYILVILILAHTAALESLAAPVKPWQTDTVYKSQRSIRRHHQNLYTLRRLTVKRKRNPATRRPARVPEIARARASKSIKISGLNKLVRQRQGVYRTSFALRSDPPFMSNPFILEIPTGTRIEIFGQGRGNRRQRIIVKEARPDATGEHFIDVVPIKVFEDNDIRPRSGRMRFTTTRPWVLYEIQQDWPGSGWGPIQLPTRYRWQQGQSTLVEQPIAEGAENEPALTFKWGGLQPTTDVIEGEEVMTVLSGDALDILLRGAQSKTSDVLIAELKKKANTGPFEDIDHVETRSLTYSLLSDGVEFKFHWWIEDLLDQPWPLGGCDCNVHLKLRLKWKIQPDGTVQMYRDAIYSGDGGIGCPGCPIQTLAIAYAQFLNAFQPLVESQDIPRGSAEFNQAFQRAFQLVINTQTGRVPVGATVVGNANVKVLGLWIDNGSLKARVRYRIAYQIT